MIEIKHYIRVYDINTGALTDESDVSSYGRNYIKNRVSVIQKQLGETKIVKHEMETIKS